MEENDGIALPPYSIHPPRHDSVVPPPPYKESVFAEPSRKWLPLGMQRRTLVFTLTCVCISVGGVLGLLVASRSNPSLG
jgi:hypothetical protein